MAYFLLKYLHLLGAIIILGTGIGIAFFMLMAHRTQDVAFIARTATVVVLADLLFTATAIVVQPITGALLMRETGVPWTTAWIEAALGLYLLAGMFWLPVVWMQRQMRDLARTAAAENAPLPPRYHRLYRLWFWFGFPGFGSVMLILWLMIAKPALWDM